jgi:hypothetical protein
MLFSCGAPFHRAFRDSEKNPDFDFNVIERGKVDDPWFSAS